MKLLFICTHNRCRSIIAEAISNHYSKGRIVAKSAGSQPAGEVHPLTLQYLMQAGINTSYLQSQSWDDFEDFSPDAIITVCDSAARETCPAYFGNQHPIHWGLPDPSRVKGTAKEKEMAFESLIFTLEQRILNLLKMDLNHTNQKDFHKALIDIATL